jgi:hypothetical protein
VQFIAGDVAAGMANRYCAAGGDAFNQRAAAWQPWSALNGVAKSEALFQEMVGLGHAPFSTIGLVDGIENTGGMQTHTCLLSGVPTPCDYVNPAAAQGANWWANTNIDGGAVGQGEAPLTAPFYVVKRNGYEERHWLAADTGYGVDISARRVIGVNARPVDAEPGSGLEWFWGTDLCDTDRPELGCPLPAAQEQAPPADDAATADASADEVTLWEKIAQLVAADDGGDAEAPEQAAADSPPAETDAGAGAETGAETEPTEQTEQTDITFLRGLSAAPSGPR